MGEGSFGSGRRGKSRFGGGWRGRRGFGSVRRRRGVTFRRRGSRSFGGRRGRGSKAPKFLFSAHAVEDNVDAEAGGEEAHRKPDEPVHLKGKVAAHCRRKGDLQREEGDERIRQIEVAERLRDGLLAFPLFDFTDDGEDDPREGIGGVRDREDKARLRLFGQCDHERDDARERSFE